MVRVLVCLVESSSGPTDKKSRLSVHRNLLTRMRTMPIYMTSVVPCAVQTYNAVGS